MVPCPPALAVDTFSHYWSYLLLCFYPPVHFLFWVAFFFCATSCMAILVAPSYSLKPWFPPFFQLQMAPFLSVPTYYINSVTGAPSHLALFRSLASLCSSSEISLIFSLFCLSFVGYLFMHLGHFLLLGIDRGFPGFSPNSFLLLVFFVAFWETLFGVPTFGCLVALSHTFHFPYFHVVLAFLVFSILIHSFWFH